MVVRLMRNVGVVCVTLALWTAPGLAGEASNDGMAGSDRANADRQEVHAPPAWPTFIEPGPMTTATLYIDGSVIEVGSETRWRPACGSRPGITQEEFMRMIEPARQAMREAGDPHAHQRAADFSPRGRPPPDPPAEVVGLNVIFSISGTPPAGAATALEQVAQYIEGTFADNTSFTVLVQFQNWGVNGPLAATGSAFRTNLSYNSFIRPGLQNGMDGDDTLQDFLPPTTFCPVRYNGASDAVSNEFAIDVTVANFRAAIGSTSGTAASITVNTAFGWDYDPSNGVSPGLFDFQSVIAHEVGHAMGFTSNVDNQTQAMEMLDLFRFQFTDGCCNYNPDTLADFQTVPRLVSFNSPNNQHISDVISAQYSMSDGNPFQASHFSSSLNALMAPAIAPGVTFFPNFMRTPDTTMFDAIGWDFPICTNPCDDLDVCTVNDVCVGQTCVGSPVDCSTAGDDCNSASCDPAGGVEGNCDALTPINEGGPCSAGTGLCQSGTCVPDPGNTRVFMTRPGFEASAPTTGPTSIFMAQGTSVTIQVWLADTEGQLLGSYQIATPASATPTPGTVGTVGYVDNPDPLGCDSLLVDMTNPQWVFTSAQPTPFCSETGLPDGIAFIANLPIGSGVAVAGLAYLGEFQFAASTNALGTFTMDFFPINAPPSGGSFMSDETGIGLVYATFQPLTLVVSDTIACTTAADCADVAPTDGITDDVCIWWRCVAGVCEGIPKVQPADLGGPLGACPLDNFCNLADALNALTCFAGDNACDPINIDAGGPQGACAPDGFCNLADALQALTCFAGNNPCTCGGPAPEMQPAATMTASAPEMQPAATMTASAPEMQPAATMTASRGIHPARLQVVGTATLSAVADRRAIRAGGQVQVRVFINGALPSFRAYQLDTVVSGGRSGSLDLVDITIEDRADFVLSSAAQDLFEAFNVENGQMLSGLFSGDVATGGRGYLATFTYRASDDAVGTFVMDVTHDEAEGGQTFLVGAEQTDQIEVTGTTPAVITVTRNVGRTVP